MRGAAVVCVLGAAACDAGALDVILVRPTAVSAQLEPATSAVLHAASADREEIVLTASITDDQVSFGDLPVGTYQSMWVELFGGTGSEVGYGRVAGSIEVLFDEHLVVQVPIRRPRDYIAGPAPGRVIEAPLQTANARLVRIDRGSAAVAIDAVELPAASALVTTAGPDMFVAAGAQIYRLDSASDDFDAAPVVDLGATIRDLAGSTDGRYLIAASSDGLHIVDIAAGNARMVAADAVDAVAAGVARDGGVTAVGLLGAVDATGSCAGVASQLLIADLDGESLADRTIDLGGGVRDIAATANGRVIAADFCRNRVTIVDLAANVVVGSATGIDAPTAVAGTDTTAWAVGSSAGEVSMRGTAEENVDQGAYHHLAVIDLTSTDLPVQTIDLAEIAQVIVPTDEPGSSLAQYARAKVATAAALSLSPRGDQLLLSSNAVHRVQQVTVIDSDFIESGVFPPMVVHTSRQYTIATATNATESVIATRCRVCASDDHSSTLDYGEGCGADPQQWGYPRWECAPEVGVTSATAANFEAGSSAALYGQP